MLKGDGYDDIRRAYIAGVAAAVSFSVSKKAPDPEAYVARLKAQPLVAKLPE